MYKRCTFVRFRYLQRQKQDLIIKAIEQDELS